MLPVHRSNNHRIVTYLSQHPEYMTASTAPSFLQESSILPMELVVTPTKYGDHPALYETGGSVGHKGVALCIFRPDFTLIKPAYVVAHPTTCNQNHAQLPVFPDCKIVAAYYTQEHATVGQFSVSEIIQDEYTGRPLAVARPEWIRSMPADELKWLRSPEYTLNQSDFYTDPSFTARYIAAHKLFEYMAVRPTWIRHWVKVAPYPGYDYLSLFETQIPTICTSLSTVYTAVNKEASVINRKKYRPFLLFRVCKTEYQHTYVVSCCLAIAKSRGGGLRSTACGVWSTFVTVKSKDAIWFPNKEPWCPYTEAINQLVQQAYGQTPDQTVRVYAFQG